MKRFISALALLTLAPLVASSASAKTTTGTVSVGATLVNGSNVVATFIVGDGVVMQLRSDDTKSAPSSPVYSKPVLRIGFDLQGAYFVKHVTWDKAHRQLTIDF
jgi:hypothetical protein